MRTLKTVVVATSALFAVAVYAAVDVNNASRAELEAVSGIGPAVAGRILDERNKGGSFKDWRDLIGRVKGIGRGNAARFSAEGLTVEGAPFVGAPNKPAAPAGKP